MSQPEFPPLLELLKAFAGPAATIIAAVAAIFVTIFFSRLQWQTANKQAETALDQLRYNLFSKRITIYEDIKQLLKLLINESHKPEFCAFDVAQHYVVMDEALFFFSPATCAWLDSLKADCEKFLQANAHKFS